MKNDRSLNDSAGPAPVNQSGTTEGSTLFPLNSLKAQAERAKSSSPRREENSGVIDIKALFAEAEQSAVDSQTPERAGHFKVATHLGVYPFGAPTPVPVVTTADHDNAVQPQPKHRARRSRTRVLLSGAAAVVAIASLGAIAAAAVQARGSIGKVRTAHAVLDPVAIRKAVALAAAPRPIAGQPVASANSTSKSAEKATDATKTASSSEVTPLRPSKAVPHIATAPVLNRTSEPAEPAPPAHKSPKPARTADDCRGDLMCAMEKAVKMQNQKQNQK